MKRSLKISLVFAVLAVMSLFCTNAYADDTVKATKVQTYNGVTYTCADTLASGKIVANDVRSLPKKIVNKGDVRSFAIYYDKIYYLTSFEGSDNVLGSIYRCNIDGSNNELIANDADALGRMFLSDGCLYYNVLFDYDNSYMRNLRGGIMKINLNTGAYGRIVTDKDATLINVLGDKVFYYAGNYHLMSTNGAYIGGISPSDVEISSDIIVGAAAYVGYDGAIYAEDWNRNSRWICNVPLYTNGYKTNYQYPTVNNVTGGYVYYIVHYYPSYSYSYSVPANTAMYRVSVNGGASELVARWFVS